MKFWHKFSKEKPEKGGSYLVITATDVEGYLFSNIMDMTYYPNVQKFNWDGSDEDTSIEVLYWANINDILPDELRRK